MRDQEERKRLEDLQYIAIQQTQSQKKLRDDELRYLLYMKNRKMLTQHLEFKQKLDRKIIIDNNNFMNNLGRMKRKIKHEKEIQLHNPICLEKYDSFGDIIINKKTWKNLLISKLLLSV
jgi:hypothetical protein